MEWQGLPWFKFSTQQNDRIELIEAEFGLKGFAIVAKLWQRIYATCGYYCEWNEEVGLLFSKKVGENLNLVSDIVNRCISRGIFDKEKYEEFSILTSEDIQENFMEAVKRRKNIEVIKEYLLIECAKNKNVCILSLNADISKKNVDISQQRRGEEKRREENIYMSGKPDDALLGGTYEEGDQPEGNAKPEEEPPSYDAVVSYLNEKAGTRYLSSSKATQRLIHARWKEGFRLKEFETAIDKKVAEWKGTDMEQYLRPATLFGTKFESYLNQPLIRAADKQRPKYNYKSDNVGNFEQRHYTEKDLDGLVAGPDNWEALDRMILNQRAKNKANKETSSE